jgi:hypothetical protein
LPISGNHPEFSDGRFKFVSRIDNLSVKTKAAGDHTAILDAFARNSEFVARSSVAMARGKARGRALVLVASAVPLAVAGLAA